MRLQPNHPTDDPAGIAASIIDGLRLAKATKKVFKHADLADLEGPWHEGMLIAPGLIAVDSTESLSAVYHAIKWSLRREASLIVVPVHQTPKSRGMAAGTTTWLRERTTRQPAGASEAGPTSSE